MKKYGKVSQYIKANRKGSREAELEVSAGWTAKTKVHKNRTKYDRKDRSWRNDSGLSILNNRSNIIIYEQQAMERIRIPDKSITGAYAHSVLPAYCSNHMYQNLYRQSN
jgi:hypothetical protein